MVKMTFTWYDTETGESLVVEWAGSGSDKGDKGLYKAMTGAEKYVLLKTFLVPTGDDPEAEEPKPRPAAKKPEAPAKLQPSTDPNAISREQAQRLGRLTKTHKTDITAFKQWLAATFKVTSLTELAKKDYDTVANYIISGGTVHSAGTH
jgi:hypothetical protein